MIICDFGYAWDYKKANDNSKYPVDIGRYMPWEQNDNDKNAKESLKADSWSLAALFLDILHPMLGLGIFKENRNNEWYSDYSDEEFKKHFDEKFDIHDPAQIIFKDLFLKMLVKEVESWASMEELY